MRSGIRLTVSAGFLLLGACETPPTQDEPVTPPPIAPEPAPTTHYVHSYMLNLRACPRMDCSILATLRRGDKVEEILQQDGWLQVRVSDRGTQGWIGARFVEPSPPSANHPPRIDEDPPIAAGHVTLPTDAIQASASGDPDPGIAATGVGAAPPSAAMHSGATADRLPTDSGPHVEEEFAP